MIQLKEVIITKITVDAQIGSVLDKCINECIVLAFTQGKDVLLNHNGKTFVIDHLKIQNSVKIGNSK